MPPIRLMMIATVTLALPNKKVLPKAPMKQSTLVFMTNQMTFSGHDISLRLKVTKSLQTFFIRTI
jgi:hypothetical protein